ncbi:MAG: TolC family outer membrane protein [Betaproteobacteria bacterium]|nr:TolC family outer membrane protein [Betaproteobacteria bacterium]
MARFPRTAALALALSASPCALSADLLEVYRAAQSSDATYASARAAWAAGREKLPQGLSGLLPSASLSGSTQQNDRDLRFRTPGLVGGESQFNTNALNVTITQPVYRRQNMVTFEQSKTQVAQSDAVFATSAQDLIVRVAQAYFDVLLAQDSVAFAQAQLSAIGQQLEQAKRNFEVGTATITDTHEAQARYDITLSAEIAASNDLEIKKRALEVIIGRQAPGLTPLGDRFSPRLPDPDNMQNWAEQALRSNLQVRAAEASLTFASQEVERNRGGHHPTVDVFATYSNTGSGASTPGAVGGGTDITTRIIGLQFAIPLYQGGAVNSRVREAVANEDRARQDLESARRQAELSVRQSFLGVTSGLAQVKALEAALVSSRSSLDSTRLGQEVGVRTQVDVLNAQQQLFQTRRDLSQAKYNYILSLLRLKAAAGSLAEEDLALVNAWLDKQ